MSGPRLLKALAKDLTEFKEELYSLSYATGATKGDSWIDIDGGIGTFFVYASKGTRELPTIGVRRRCRGRAVKAGTFVGQHICVPLEGAAVHINAFNFPVWGMLEKLAPALLAGVPAIVKPATVTSYLTELVFRRIIDSGIFPQGAVQSSAEASAISSITSRARIGVLHRLGEHRATAKTHPAIVANAVRFTAETDSLNSSILGPDAGPGSPSSSCSCAKSRAR